MLGGVLCSVAVKRARSRVVSAGHRWKHLSCNFSNRKYLMQNTTSAQKQTKLLTLFTSVCSAINSQQREKMRVVCKNPNVTSWGGWGFASCPQLATQAATGHNTKITWVTNLASACFARLCAKVQRLCRGICLSVSARIFEVSLHSCATHIRLEQLVWRTPWHDSGWNM